MAVAVHNITLFQSTHPRGVRPGYFLGTSSDSGISIHAPAWGATLLSASALETKLISIHAPAWGATGVPRPCGGAREFQSTHPRGVRLRSQARRSPSHAISIHAPAWGATCAVACWQEERLAFQSTHPRGVRPSDVCFKPIFSPFQSTHPRGVRPGTKALERILNGISIHAPAWGATQTLITYTAD